MMPAWGPPSSLSPEQIAVAPAATLSDTRGSPVNPNASSESSSPLPTSCTTGIARARPSVTSSVSVASVVYPARRKFERWTFRRSRVRGLMASW